MDRGMKYLSMDRGAKYLIVLFLLFFAGSTAFAQETMGFRGIGGKVGLVDPQDIGSTVGFGAFVDLGSFAPNFYLEANFDYWNKTDEVFGGEFTLRDFIFGGTVKYVYDVEGQKFKPFGLGALQLHLLKEENSFDGSLGFQDPSPSSSDTKLGFDLGGGTYFAASSKVYLITELRYRIVSDVSQLVFSVGITLFHAGQ